jgi:hypothetical protein
MQTVCPECGASLLDGATCRDHFYQMLYWEAENPINWEVHHLMVLCYHLQHPSLYSLEMMPHAILLLADFVESGITPQEVRQRDRDRVDSGKRNWKITATPESQGAYANPIPWPITVADVIRAGEPRYRDSVWAWSRSMMDAIKASGNFT